jgi:hypothetical protein
MGVSNGDGDGGGVDGDLSGGTSPSRQDAGTETSVPRNLSSRWRRLRNFSGELGEVARVFPVVRINRRKVVNNGVDIIVENGNYFVAMIPLPLLLRLHFCFKHIEIITTK